MLKYFLIPILLASGHLHGQPSVELKIDTTNTDSNYTVTKSITRFDDRQYISSIDEVKVYYRNWLIKEAYSLIDGEVTGLYFSYYPNGDLKEIYNNSKGRMIGIYLCYYPEGKLKTLGTYKDLSGIKQVEYHQDTTKKIDSFDGFEEIFVVKTPISVKIGKWYFYNEKGVLIKIEEY
jgi:antitoxin component YwqK of YwqJK toxin-antitoxin module